ncbi:MAG: transcriptional repressor TCF25 family protein [Syntrophales bacterium]
MTKGKLRGTLRVEQVGPKEWKFEFPPAGAELDEQFDLGIDLMDEGEDRKAEKIFRAVIKACPLHIDAHHHLAMLLFYRDEILPAIRTWAKAVDIGIRSLPREFHMGENRLEWGWIENRPFLRACKGLGCGLLDVEEFLAARRIFNDLLVMNPNDNQGVRALAIKVAFAINLPAEVLKVCNHYKSDCLVDTLYGRPLALFRMGKRAQAKKALINAVDAYPLVARELLKKRHPVPKNMSSSHVTLGGADEAFDYWRNLGQFWKETEGALEFLTEVLVAHHPKTAPTAKVIPFRR